MLEFYKLFSNPELHNIKLIKAISSELHAPEYICSLCIKEKKKSTNCTITFGGECI